MRIKTRTKCIHGFGKVTVRLKVPKDAKRAYAKLKKHGCKFRFTLSDDGSLITYILAESTKPICFWRNEKALSPKEAEESLVAWFKASWAYVKSLK